ncbi:LAQU0S04e07580g1_1 [Lachancea quebecensis]|uniref:LAQU0S04e07580g1_1 n=1 Tax=Lachancea quebecensis TaxID=1654605 RepID=A0A0P1KQ19_9SACH|nr:LAQU0S04e07580g1_1 [Lachancea quebecensis]
MSAPLKIKPLAESVVNKIAAGEIIVAPVNALKEMMENSIDAGATTIDILVKEGGLKILQITDNGSGIDKSDLPILCQRFTTSKLKTFEDLSSIQTYGFRGEALASISHIARVTVTTKTKNEACAWKVSYSAGKMMGEPKPIAGRDGTIILVEDLFYNVQSRLRSLRSPSDELAKILDCVGRYAINSKNVGFSCKKFGESQFALTVRNEADVRERVQAVFGRGTASNLIELEVPEIQGLGASASGQVSTLNFINKKSISPIFFINNRLVTCDPLRRALYQTYSSHLAKGNRPFIYLNVTIRPELVDVNVHPTKREVRFLHDEEIIEQIASQLADVLSNCDTSRSFKTTSIFTQKPVSIKEGLGKPHSQIINNLPVTPLGNKVKRQENKLVRIDASQTKITNFLKSAEYTGEAEESTLHKQPYEDDSPHAIDHTSESMQLQENWVVDTPSRRTPKTSSYTVSRKMRVEVNLASVNTLRKEADSNMNKDLTNVFANLTYVGLVDEQRRLACIQHDLRLFLVDYGSICSELFYQVGLTDFANFGRIYLVNEDESAGIREEGLSVGSLIEEIVSSRGGSVAELIRPLWDMREMLEEYFSIELYGGDNQVENTKIKSLPLLIKGYIPPLSKLPHFLYRILTKIDWSDEMKCLQGILKQIALLYVPEMIEQIDPEDSSIEEEERVRYLADTENMEKVLEETIFPCIKKRLLAPRGLLKSVIEVANLPGLYRVFERC